MENQVMSEHVGDTERLFAVDGEYSPLPDSASKNYEDNEDGNKYDSDSEAFLSAEEDEIRIEDGNIIIGNVNDDTVVATLHSPSLKTYPVSYLDSSDIEHFTSYDVLESATILVEGIRTLRTSQEENWKKMNDLVTKKDHLIKEMTELVRLVQCFKDKIVSSNLEKESNMKSYTPLTNHLDADLIPEKDTISVFTKNKKASDYIEDMVEENDPWTSVIETSKLIETQFPDEAFSETTDEDLGVTDSSASINLGVPTGYADDLAAEEKNKSTF